MRHNLSSCCFFCKANAQVFVNTRFSEILKHSHPTYEMCDQPNIVAGRFADRLEMIRTQPYIQFVTSSNLATYQGSNRRSNARVLDSCAKLTHRTGPYSQNSSLVSGWVTGAVG